MARCFACNIIVQEGYDKKTDRHYCFDCFDATNKVILRNLETEEDLFGAVSIFSNMDDWVTDNLYPTDADLDIIKDQEWDD